LIENDDVDAAVPPLASISMFIRTALARIDNGSGLEPNRMSGLELVRAPTGRGDEARE